VRRSRVEIDVEPLTTQQVLELIQAMPERYRALTVVAAATGLRQGEVFGLTVDNLDFLRRQVRVEQQMKHLAPRRPFLARPKTPSSVRTVPLPDVALEAAAEHLRRWPAATAMRATSGRDELLVFTTGTGGPLTRATFNMTWRRRVKAAKLPEGTGFHELRHFYASLLIASGASVKTVQARLGHKSALETLNTYAHLWPDSEDQTTRAVDVALGGPAASSRPAEGSQGL
jgi:integrase